MEMREFSGCGNCNIKYINGLNAYWPNMVEALFDTFTCWSTPWDAGKGKRQVKVINTNRLTPAFLLWTQGSEHSERSKPYAATFASVIEKLELGKVTKIGPAPSPLHSGKPTTMYVWELDQLAIRKWVESEISILQLGETNEV